jgi:hypothetical protein
MMNMLLGAMGAFKWSSLLMMGVLVLGLFLSSGLLYAAQPDPITAEKARTAMVEWLECEECTEGQLRDLLEQGRVVEGLLIATLKSGLAPANRELYKRELEKRYDKLIAYAERHPKSKPTLDKARYVALYMGNFEAQYRTRAAEALVKMDSAEGRDAVVQVMKETRRKDVQQALEGYLNKAK